ncbi:transcriptional regulator YeiL [Clostridium sp. Marseille-P2415]|uniref:transcriptional regulator YeiL n=1 Tax=Clostridium sp. Marseille-P2415 TaxID=1805471 RepID=UPI0009887157|nr:transcriptional regulator YeiL [Clostridium sp. Marseille-P2415]
MKTKGSDVIIPAYVTNIFSFDITPYAKVKEYQKNQLICREGDDLSDLIFLIDGNAKLFLTHENGKITIIDFLKSPTLFGEMEFMRAQKFTNGIIALDKCICILLPIRETDHLLRNDIKFLNYLCLFLCKKALRNTSNYATNQNYPLVNRLARFILLSADGEIYNRKHTEVAEYLGVSYRHLLHVFALFCEANILQHTDKKEYIIKDFSSLAAMAVNGSNQR